MKTKNGCHIGWVYCYKCVDPSMEQYFGRIVYVGQSRAKGGVIARDYGHKNGTKTPFDRAYRKHPESFQLIGEEEFLATSEGELIEMLNEYESKLIIFHDCIKDNGHGFNLTNGGGTKGVSEETRQKLSKRLKTYYSTSEAKQMCSERAKKMWQNEDHKKMQSERSTKMWQNEERKKMHSELVTKLWQNPEHRQKVIDAQKKRFSMPDARQKKSEIMKKKYTDPAERSKLSVSLKGKNNKSCKIFDLESGFYFDFNSCTEAHKFVGMPKNELRRYKTKPYKGRYLFIPD